MIGVAVTRERKWHASWWGWHGLIVTAYLIVGLAARLEWRDERFRRLYLPTTRERHQEISVLFADLVGFTGFAERSSPTAGCSVLDRLLGHRSAADHKTVRRQLEKFVGDGLMATFNNSGDQPIRAESCMRRSYAPARVARLADQNPGWPRMRIGVNSGSVIVHEVGGDGHVAYPVLGDTVNTAHV